MHYEILEQMKKHLGQLDKWLDAAEAFAKTKSFEPSVFLELRLAPDQFTFARQVCLACDTAKLAATRLSGKEEPAYTDEKQTIDSLHERVRSTIAALDGLSEEDFADVASRSITQPRWAGKTMSGPDYFLEHALPNFYFHLTHAYALLRHNGVPVGKRDYLGTLSMRPAPAS